VFVVAVVADKEPALALLVENVTVTPLTGPVASVTVAVTVATPPDAGRVAAESDREIDVGTRTGVPIVSIELSLTAFVPTVTAARMVAVAFTAAAVNWVVATPEASVTTVAVLNVPDAALITEKVTLMLGQGAVSASVTVAVTVAEPPEPMVGEESVTRTAAGIPE
jgi:hypothetical protein